MCNPGKFLSRATGIGANDLGPTYGQPAKSAPAPAPAPAPTPAPAPAPAPAPVPQIDYAGLAKGYTDYARPQIDKQYSNAQDALRTGIIERGLGGSSIDKSYTDNLNNAYQGQLSGLGSQADTYAHSGASGYTPLGDLFTSLIKPVATFNANNKFGTPATLGSDTKNTGTGVNLSSGSSAKVVQ
jgi:hypothetical protein